MLLTDTSAAKGMVGRVGTGKVIHIDVSQLWLQDKIRSGDIVVVKVKGTENIADALTKYVDVKGLAVHVDGCILEYREGRHQDSPEIAGGDAIQGIDWEDDGMLNDDESAVRG